MLTQIWYQNYAINNCMEKKQGKETITLLFADQFSTPNQRTTAFPVNIK